MIENMKYYSVPANKQFNHEDAIDVPTFTTCRSIFRLAEFLQRLHFKGEISVLDQLKLNDLTQLEELRIDLIFPIDETAKVIRLSLPNLKALEICTHCSDKRRFYLTTPRLKMLKCYMIDKIHLAHPSTIDHLEVEIHTGNGDLLKNVEFLKAGGIFPQNENFNIFSVFPKLTTLVCDNRFEFQDKEAATLNSLRHLVAQKRKQPEFKIYFKSVELIDREKIDEYQATGSDLAFHFNNYNLLCDKIRLNKPLDYNELMRLVGDASADDLYNKYSNIESVKISGIFDG